MPIKVFFPKEGAPYAEADTPEEAASLLKLNSNGFSPSKLDWPLKTVPIGDAAVAQFFLTINENARKLLLTLLKHEKGVRGGQFSEETGIVSEKFGGIFGGASKIAKKHGLKLEQFVRSEMIVKDNDRYRFFKPGKLLLENAEKLKQAAKEGAVRLG